MQMKKEDQEMRRQMHSIQLQKRQAEVNAMTLCESTWQDILESMQASGLVEDPPSKTWRHDNPNCLDCGQPVVRHKRK